MCGEEEVGGILKSEIKQEVTERNLNIQFSMRRLIALPSGTV